MKHIKLFEEFNSLNEGIAVYPQGNPWKPVGNMTWPGFKVNVEKWMSDGTAITGIAEFDYDKFTADEKYRSEPLGTWNNTDLPKFLDKNPRYDESEFDIIGFMENEEKPREPWVRIQDKKGLEFLIAPHKFYEIQKGASVRDGVAAGATYLVDNMRATVIDYKNGIVKIKMQNNENKEIPVEEWKNHHYLELGT